MSVSDRSIGDIVIVDVVGDLVHNRDYGSLKKRIRQLLDLGHRRLVLNLSQVPYVNSWGIGELATSFVSVRNLKGVMKVAASQERVTTMLSVSKLDTVIDVFETEAAALESFATRPAGDA